MIRRQLTVQNASTRFSTTGVSATLSLYTLFIESFLYPTGLGENTRCLSFLPACLLSHYPSDKERCGLLGLFDSARIMIRSYTQTSYFKLSTWLSLMLVIL